MEGGALDWKEDSFPILNTFQKEENALIVGRDRIVGA
jgi:hypothetical protein